ncbi:toll/interleukin-1 receptor domain-containing protein [Gulosibacter chungangensis]|uniref:TIR domain-containing protein n=1 Tax=Gulosibacter chungangensis TaxID=979746 RepID=A0A7J5B8T7_9MICO|nr:toll/interleukin-1 receptor domain-containing protein [Gulosibacter chungangensis]KAB1640580.1 TIR domain-containing protein [Gulosibacter chungangensis]
MANITGFWSYVHTDDEDESGRISQLARDVSSKFTMLTGEPIQLFLDRDELDWGDDWRSKIDSSLASIAFFVPVITPRYFMSEECRRELNYFARRAARLGIDELVLPVLWVDFSSLRADNPTDDLITLVRTFQWSDWTHLKYAEVGTGEYRRAVDELATRLVRANESATVSQALLEEAADLEEEEGPGELETLASMESSLPEMTNILVEVGEAIQSIGESMQGATIEIGGQQNPRTAMANRLRVARELSQSLKMPTDNIRNLGNDFASSLNEVDQGVRLMIARAPEEIERNPASATQFEDFFESIRSMLPEAEQGLGSVQNMIEQIEPIEKLSRDLRKPMRTLREGLTMFVDGLEVMRGWVALIDDTQLHVAS